MAGSKAEVGVDTAETVAAGVNACRSDPVAPYAFLLLNAAWITKANARAVWYRSRLSRHTATSMTVAKSEPICGAAVRQTTSPLTGSTSS